MAVLANVERCGSLVECFGFEHRRGGGGGRCVAPLCLVLVQHRKTRPDMTEKNKNVDWNVNNQYNKVLANGICIRAFSHDFHD